MDRLPFSWVLSATSVTIGVGGDHSVVPIHTIYKIYYTMHLGSGVRLEGCSIEYVSYGVYKILFDGLDPIVIHQICMMEWTKGILKDLGISTDPPQISYMDVNTRWVMCAMSGEYKYVMRLGTLANVTGPQIRIIGPSLHGTYRLNDIKWKTKRVGDTRDIVQIIELTPSGVRREFSLHQHSFNWLISTLRFI